MKPILEIKNISKKYKLRGQESPYLTLRDALTSGFKNNKSKDEFWALNDVSFDVYPGESIGIIGRNGAGKSTLLKILSRITPPTTGEIISRGRIASLLEVGTGFHAELSGRENIFLNGSILGLTKKEITKQFDAIVDFSGVEKFLDTPLKHYSSGMQLRLAFAVAAHLEPEILIIDEVLAVGDAEFQKRCLTKMGEVTSEGRTVLFVSHNMAAVQTLCNKGILIQNGKLQTIGSIESTIYEYRECINELTSNIKVAKGVFNLNNHSNKKEGLRKGMTKVFTYCDNLLSDTFYAGCNFRFDIEVENIETYDSLLYGFVIKNSDGIGLIGINNRHTGNNFIVYSGKKYIFKTELPKLPIYRDGLYTVDLYWGNHNTSHEIIFEAFSFEVEKTDVFRTANLLDSKINLIYIEKVNFSLIE